MFDKLLINGEPIKPIEMPKQRHFEVIGKIDLFDADPLSVMAWSLVATGLDIRFDLDEAKDLGKAIADISTTKGVRLHWANISLPGIILSRPKSRLYCCLLGNLTLPVQNKEFDVDSFYYAEIWIRDTHPIFNSVETIESEPRIVKPAPELRYTSESGRSIVPLILQ